MAAALAGKSKAHMLHPPLPAVAPKKTEEQLALEMALSGPVGQAWRIRELSKVRDRQQQQQQLKQAHHIQKSSSASSISGQAGASKASSSAEKAQMVRQGSLPTASTRVPDRQEPRSAATGQAVVAALTGGSEQPRQTRDHEKPPVPPAHGNQATKLMPQSTRQRTTAAGAAAAKPPRQASVEQSTGRQQQTLLERNMGRRQAVPADGGQRHRPSTGQQPTQTTGAAAKRMTTDLDKFLVNLPKQKRWWS